MISSFFSVQNFVCEDTPDSLIISQPRHQKIQGAFLLLVASATLLAMLFANFGLGWSFVVFCCGTYGLWLLSRHHSVKFDKWTRQITVSTNRFLFGRKNKIIPFEDVKQIWLDVWEKVYPGRYGIGEGQVEHKWTIFLALNNGEIVNMVQEMRNLSNPISVIVADRLTYLQELGEKIGQLTDKPFLQTSSVPGQPHTFIDHINQLVERRLSQERMPDHSVQLKSRADGELMFIVDGHVYEHLADIPNASIRELIQSAVVEWQENT